MDITTIFDLTNLILILMGSFTIISTGFLNKFMNLYKSFIISTSVIFTSGFLIANYLTTINQMRIVVLSLTFFVIFPWIISYLLIWMFKHSETTLSRINFATFVSWILSLMIISSIRILFGWGFETVFALIVSGLVLSISIGLLGGIIGNYLIDKIEKINPRL